MCYHLWRAQNAKTSRSMVDFFSGGVGRSDPSNWPFAEPTKHVLCSDTSILHVCNLLENQLNHLFPGGTCHEHTNRQLCTKVNHGKDQILFVTEKHKETQRTTREQNICANVTCQQGNERPREKYRVEAKDNLKAEKERRPSGSKHDKGATAMLYPQPLWVSAAAV